MPKSPKDMISPKPTADDQRVKMFINYIDDSLEKANKDEKSYNFVFSNRPGDTEPEFICIQTTPTEEEAKIIVREYEKAGWKRVIYSMVGDRCSFTLEMPTYRSQHQLQPLEPAVLPEYGRHEKMRAARSSSEPSGGDS